MSTTDALNVFLRRASIEVAKMRLVPVLDIAGAHRGHRLANDRARQVGEEGGRIVDVATR